MSSKKKIVETRDTIGATFKELGFKPTASNGKSADHRATLKRDQWQVLLPTINAPWVTLQRLNSSGVQYFVDFPLESPLPAVVMYMEVAS
jgi:hypothetical protein